MALLGRKPAIARDMRDPLVMRAGLTMPSLFDVITHDDGSPFPQATLLAGTVLFSMRPLLSRTPVIDNVAARVVDPVQGDDGFNIAYDWADGDTAIEGSYMCWWGVESAPSVVQESDEFPLVISDHGPGLGVPTGAVVDGIGQYMPITFEALREDQNFGDRFMQRFADRAKRETMNTVVTPDLEIDYDPQLIDYLAKLAAKHLVVPAKDYWARQWRTRTTQSPIEISAYPDMLAALDSLYARLSEELPEDLLQLRYWIPGLIITRVMVAPGSSLEDCAPVTIDPNFTRRPRLNGPRFGGFFFP